MQPVVLTQRIQVETERTFRLGHRRETCREERSFVIQAVQKTKDERGEGVEISLQQFPPGKPGSIADVVYLPQERIEGIQRETGTELRQNGELACFRDGNSCYAIVPDAYRTQDGGGAGF